MEECEKWDLRDFCFCKKMGMGQLLLNCGIFSNCKKFQWKSFTHGHNENLNKWEKWRFSCSPKRQLC